MVIGTYVLIQQIWSESTHRPRNVWALHMLASIGFGGVITKQFITTNRTSLVLKKKSWFETTFNLQVYCFNMFRILSESMGGRKTGIHFRNFGC